MNDLIKATPSQTMSSREIAELTGKRHDHVMRDIREMLVQLHGEGGIPSFGDTHTNEQNGQSYPIFRLPKRETLILVSGYSVELRARIIDRWEELETKSPAPSLPTTYIEALEHLLIAKKAEQQAIAERDHAIATKAQIGSKREATAMATASQAVRQANALQAELGRCKDHATIIAVQNVTRIEYKWQSLRKWCKDRGVKPIEVIDPRWGIVKSWPAQAWADVYGVDLGLVFARADF